MPSMHLTWSQSSYKGRTYRSYYIARSYRDQHGRPRKETLFRLGQLTPQQAQTIQMILRVASDPSAVICRLEDILPISSLDYLDLAVAKALWEEYNLSAAFSRTESESDVPTSLVAEVLTINRCVAPSSHYAIERWLRKTTLPQMLGVPPERFNDDKLYYELDKIAEAKEQIEEHLFSLLQRRDPESMRFLTYDLTTSYFVGVQCPLSRFGHSKDNRPGTRQVLLGLLVNRNGLPFHWDVWPGNTAETTTLRHVADVCRRRFELQNVTLVFDRGIVSEENLKAIEEEGLHYISTLDRNQLPSVPNAPLDLFDGVTLEQVETEHWRPEGFDQYDDRLWFCDLGDSNGRRYVLGFNPELMIDQRKARAERMRLFETFLDELNQELAHARKSRKAEPALAKVRGKLKQLKLSSFYQPPKAQEIFLSTSPTNGEAIGRTPSQRIRSWRIVIEQASEKLRAAERLDGLCVFISSHVQKRPEGGYRISARQIVETYRKKTHIEDAFKHIKSFLRIRPFYVNTDAHVRAVYTICVLAYFLNRTLAQRRQEIEGKDFLNSEELYAPFAPCKLVQFTAPATDRTASKTVQLTAERKRLLRALHLEHLERPMFTKTM